MSERSVLVGRDAERAVIEAALERCRANEGGFVLVSGEAGVGKSRLVADALRGSQARLLRGSAVGGGRSYGLLRDMLRAVHDEIADADVRRSLGPLLPGHGMPDTVCRTRNATARLLPTPCDGSFDWWPTMDRRSSSSRTCIGPTRPRWTSCPRWRSRSKVSRC
ncbi:MAG: AAA family ATPase [Actinophytocola sp.]|nr:AAA family ATPase [Actinophytocola sp.]